MKLLKLVVNNKPKEPSKMEAWFKKNKDEVILTVICIAVMMGTIFFVRALETWK